MKKAAKSSKPKIQREKVVKRSAADFFQDNKAIAGFDNTMRVVFTSIRELVENGLDAAERMGKLPEIHVKIERLRKEEIAKLLNVTTFDSSDKVDFIKLSVRDNGSGIQSEFVPPLFGRVLTGSNYGARQSRGRFGLGAKMVLLNAMSSVDLPLIIKSKHFSEDFTSYHEIMINLAENEPIILNKREIPQNTTEAIPESGTEVTVTFTGSWNLASRWIREYFSQISLITPYATFYITYPESDKPEILERVVEEMPPYPKIAKVHPWGTDITQFKRELAVTTSKTMVDFLQDHFQGIGPKKAREFLDYIKIPHEKKPKDLSASDIRRIVHEGFTVPDPDPKKRRKQRYFPFTRPSGDSLSPLGADLLAKGIEKELKPKFVRAASGEVSAYLGHPFIVEAAIAYGGSVLSKDEGSRSSGPKIYRFANRIPLLFGAGNDIITKCVQRMNWKNYKIKINKAPIAIVVSVVSSKIPFPETSKEYIADVDELRKEIIRVLKKLARGLSQHLGRAERERRERQRQSRFETAAPKVLKNLANILQGEETPFILSSPEEVLKLEKALASAVPRYIRRIYPPSPLISSIGEWLPPDIYAKLVENNIQTIYQFLRAPVLELSKITGYDEERIVEIKRNTVTSDERSKNAPSMREFDLFPKIIENDYSKYRDAPKIHRALNKRWIVSSLDFFVTPVSQLRLVEFFPQKLIFELKLETITRVLEKYSLESFRLSLIPWIDKDIEKALKSVKVSSILDYLVAFPEKLADIPNLSIKLIEEAKHEIRQGVKEGYIDPEKVIGAATFDWMDYRVTPRLRGRNISRIKEFLQAPTEKLSEIQELAENLIARSKQLKLDILDSLNTENNLMKFANIQESMIADLERINVKGLIDFLLAEDKDLVIVRGLLNLLVIAKQDQVLKQISQKYEIFPTKNACWLDSEIETQLRNIDIETVFDFIKYPSSKLLKIKNLDPFILETIKRTYGSPIPFLSSEEIQQLTKNNVYCLEELESSIEEGIVKPASLKNKLKEILKVLSEPICYLSISSEFYYVLHHVGVSRIIDFLMWPDNELHRKTGIPYKEIERTKSTLSLEGIKKNIENKTLPMSVLNKNLKPDKWKKLYETDLTLQELYYNLPYSFERITSLNFSKKDYLRINEVFNTPISSIPRIRSRWIYVMHSFGIDTFADLISWERENLGKIIGRDLNFITDFLSNFEEFLSGMALTSLGVFDTSEIKALLSNGFKTVEQVYFCAKRETFGIMGVKWKKIERYQRILETPIAMLELQSSNTDGANVRISHDGLERLAENGIDQIIKLIYWNEEELKTILRMSAARIKELKKSIAIKEQGMPLEIVAGYNRKTISILLGYGIETVEDLYFSASEDMLDEEDELNWSYVEKGIKALDLPVTYLTGIIAEKYIKILVEKRIDTIIRFLITSEEELSEILHTPPENVANLRQKINLVRLKDSTDTSVSILEGLSRKELKSLADEGIFTLFDFLTTADEKLSSYLEVDMKRIAELKLGLNYSNIEAMKEEKMIPLSKISLINKRTVKKLAKLGIDSLSDLYYVVSPKTFENSDIEWKEIQDIRVTLNLPIEMSPIINPEEIELLHKNKIQNLLDMMMDSIEEIEKRTKIPASRVKAIQESISIDEIVTMLERITIDKVEFPQKYRELLVREEIHNLYELLTSPNEEVYLKSKGDQKIRVPMESWAKIIAILSLPLSLIMQPKDDHLKLLKQKRIVTLRDAFVTSEEKISDILGDFAQEFLETLRTLYFQELYQFTQIPICYFPKLLAEWMPAIKEHKLFRIGQLYFKSPKDLSGILPSSAPKIRSMIASVSMADILKCMEDEMISIEKFSDIITESDIKNLNSKEILSIQELLLHEKDELKIKGLDDFYEMMSSPINRLSEDLSLGELRKLSDKGVKTLYDWYFLPAVCLSSILGLKTDRIISLKKDFDVLSSSQISEVTTPLEKHIESGYVEFEELSKLGIKVLEDLAFIEIEKLEVSDKMRTRLANLKDALNSSLAYFSLLPSHYVIPLAFNGITSVLQFIQTEYSQLENPMDIDEEEYNNARNNLDLVSIITHKKTESEYRVKLSSLRAFTPKQLEQIQKLGINDVIDLYFRLDLEQLPKSLVRPVDTVKRVLEKPLALLPSVQEAFPQKIPLLFNAGIGTIIEFLFWNKDELAQLLEIKRYEVSKYRKMNLGALKRKKNLGTPIDNFVRIPEDYIDAFKEMGIDNIEDLYFHLKRRNFIPEEVIPPKLIQDCIKDLENPVARLAGVPIPVKQELVKKGINRVIDFLYWPESDLKTVYGLSLAKIKQIKSRIMLRRKTDVMGRLDSYMEGGK
ncbi:MAG: DNA topoisomerase VI subunit B [Candidatus Hodarchaeales archaeon]